MRAIYHVILINIDLLEYLKLKKYLTEEEAVDMLL